MKTILFGLFLTALSQMFSAGVAAFPVIIQDGNKYSDSCYKPEDLEQMKNRKAVIFGRLQKFTPWESGKGSGHMFWQWEIVLYGNVRIPVLANPPAKVSFENYADNDVVIFGKVFYGIIIGDDNPEHQSMTGYRIDADSVFIDNIIEPDIQLGEVNYPECRTETDITANSGKDARIYGMLLEYTPPRDSSKLGNEKIWNYIIKLSDGFTIPVNDNLSGTVFNSFTNKNVVLTGRIFYGIIFGAENTANITGYRIDSVSNIHDDPYDDRFNDKINIDLTKFTDDGYRVSPNGEKSATFYEFCIPASDSVLMFVKSIDPTAGEMKGSKGRSGCTDTEWLVIGSTRQPGFKSVLKKLAALPYIKKINETFWE